MKRDFTKEPITEIHPALARDIKHAETAVENRSASHAFEQAFDLLEIFETPNQRWARNCGPVLARQRQEDE